MPKRYLKQAPTLIVIGVTGLAAWPVLFPEGNATPSKAEAKPPSAAKGPPALATASDRDPFLDERWAKASASVAATSSKPKDAAPKGNQAAALPALPADEDQVLGGMKLGGTFVAGLEQIAIIDDRVYARGEQLRKQDGSLLPYVVAAVRKDHAIVRRGRRDFVLGFSNNPGTGVPRVPAPILASATAPPAGARPSAGIEPGFPSRKGQSPANRPGEAGGDAASMLLKMLAGLGSMSGAGSSGGNGGPTTGSGLAGLLGGATGADLGSVGNVPVNQDTVQAGLDAIMGKNDSIGRDGSNPGGSTP